VAGLLRLGRGRRILVVCTPLTGALELPQPFAEAPGNLGQLLPAKEKQGDQQNEQ
jgi:hypothetical protein